MKTRVNLTTLRAAGRGHAEQGRAGLTALEDAGLSRRLSADRQSTNRNTPAPRARS